MMVFSNQIPMFLHFHFSPPSEFRSAVVALRAQHPVGIIQLAGLVQAHQQHNGHHHHAQKQQHTQHRHPGKRHPATMFRMAQIFQLRILSAAAIPAELFFSMSSKPLMTNQVA